MIAKLGALKNIMQMMAERTKKRHGEMKHGMMMIIAKKPDDKVTMDKKDFVKEHEELIEKLAKKEPDDLDDEKEKQKKELEDETGEKEEDEEDDEIIPDMKSRLKKLRKK